MPGIGINISFEFEEQTPDGSLCSKCEGEIINSMYRLLVSVNSGDPLGFEMLPSKYVFCEACKVKTESKD